MKYVYPFRGLLFVLLFFLFLGGVWNLHSVTGYAKEEQKEEGQGVELTEEEEAQIQKEVEEALVEEFDFSEVDDSLRQMFPTQKLKF